MASVCNGSSFLIGSTTCKYAFEDVLPKALEASQVYQPQAKKTRFYVVNVITKNKMF